MNREVHVRVWERAEVKFLRATRQSCSAPLRHSPQHPGNQTIQGRTSLALECQKRTVLRMVMLACGYEPV
jgi:hypothetical protein